MFYIDTIEKINDSDKYTINIESFWFLTRNNKQKAMRSVSNALCNYGYVAQPTLSAMGLTVTLQSDTIERAKNTLSEIGVATKRPWYMSPWLSPVRTPIALLGSIFHNMLRHFNDYCFDTKPLDVQSTSYHSSTDVINEPDSFSTMSQSLARSSNTLPSKRQNNVELLRQIIEKARAENEDKQKVERKQRQEAFIKLKQDIDAKAGEIIKLLVPFKSFSALRRDVATFIEFYSDPQRTLYLRPVEGLETELETIMTKFKEFKSLVNNDLYKEGIFNLSCDNDRQAQEDRNVENAYRDKIQEEIASVSAFDNSMGF